MAPPSLQSSIVIDSTNKWLDIKKVSTGTTYNVDITEGTYGDINDITAALQVALRAEGGNPFPAATVAVVFDQSIPGKIKLDSGLVGDTVQLLWDSGANRGSSIGITLGFSTLADDTGSASYYSDYQHPHGWYALRYPRAYGPIVPEVIGGELRVPLAGTAIKVVHIGYQHTISVDLAEIPYYIMLEEYATSTNTNRALESVWERGIAGYALAWYADQTLSTHTHMYLEGPRSWKGTCIRPHVDLHTYDIVLELRKVES